jgi:hypothetical protein
MSTPSHDPNERLESTAEEPLPETVTRDSAYWARLTPSLTVGEVPAEAVNINVTGRRQVSPIQGFGKMWQKTYKVALGGASVTPQTVISEWKANFPKFWPPRNNFYGPITGIAPGDVALLNLTMPGRLRLSTGVLVMYADEESFTLMTPQGHMFAGWITFSAYEKEGETVAQAQVLMRANDPMYEMGLAMGGHRSEDRFWEHTLTSLAAHFGVDGEVDTQVVCVDKKRQWHNARNIKYNAAIRSSFYSLGAPFRAARRAGPKPEPAPTETEAERRD